MREILLLERRLLNYAMVHLTSSVNVDVLLAKTRGKRLRELIRLLLVRHAQSVQVLFTSATSREKNKQASLRKLVFIRRKTKRRNKNK